MFIKRRDMCLLLPAVFFPAVMRPEGMAAQEGSMPSAMYPFEKLPIRTPNNAQIRDVLKGKLATGESLEVHETTLPPGTPPCALRNVADSRRCGRTYGQRYELSSRAWLRGARALQ